MNNYTLVLWENSDILKHIPQSSLDLQSVRSILSKNDLDQFMVEESHVRYSTVYIQANPAWNEVPIKYHGYEALEYLLKHYQRLLDVDSENFTLNVFADNKPINVYNHCKKTNQEKFCPYIAAFPPLLRYSGSTQPLETRSVSKTTFSILRRSTIDVGFILNKLLHDIPYCFNESDQDGKKFNSFKEELLSKETIFVDSPISLPNISQVVERIKNFVPSVLAENKAFAESLERLMLADRRVLDGQLANTEDEKNPLNFYEIMVLEDDLAMNSRISDWLTHLGASVKSFHSGTEASNYLNERIRQERPFDCCFVDLEIKIQPDPQFPNVLFYDYVQGLDIVDLLNTNFPTVPICLLTGAPKTIVSELPSDKVFRIFKKNEVTIIPDLMNKKSFFDDLVAEISRKKNMYGPNQGWHKNREFINYYYSLSKTTVDGIYDTVKHKVVTVKDKMGDERISCFNVRSGGKNHPPNDELLELLLINRLFIIGFALTINEECNGESDQVSEDFSDYAQYPFIGYCLLKYFTNKKPSVGKKDKALKQEAQRGIYDLPEAQSWLCQNLGFSVGGVNLNEKLPPITVAEKGKRREKRKLESRYTEYNLTESPFFLKSLHNEEDFFDQEWELIQEFKDSFNNDDFFEFLTAKVKPT